MPASGDPPVDPLTAKTGLNATERSLRAARAAHTRWLDPDAREAARVKARESMNRRFAKQVDPDNSLPPAERAKLAENARKAHLLGMSLKASRARRLRKERKAAGEGAA